ncbi:hypothetical protein MN116_008025 [Schistosoma mekongi]|uniref:Uncharacterized protein n=1 Tax=Schistosoma mekongi TaxID=38744 RepID=A0AAE1Z756_SCHME|nr:hypothetical protein MN116_008025 [Schistosoma mekongi]
MSDDFNIDHHQIELNVADLLIDNVMHSTLSSSSSLSTSSLSSSYTVSSVEMLALTLTFLYYVIMICLGVLCWLNARRKYKQRQKHTSTLIWSRFEISPNQLHIKYTDDDGDSMAT